MWLLYSAFHHPCSTFQKLTSSHKFLKKFIAAKHNLYPAEKLKWVTLCYANVRQPLKYKTLTISKQPSNSHQVQVGVTAAAMNKWAGFLLNALGSFMYSLCIIGLGIAAQFHAQLEMIRGLVSGVSKSLQRNPLLITCRGFLSFLLLVRGGPLFCVACDRWQHCRGLPSHSQICSDFGI